MRVKAVYRFSPLQLRRYDHIGNITYACYRYIVDRKMKSLQLDKKKFYQQVKPDWLFPLADRVESCSKIRD